MLDDVVKYRMSGGRTSLGFAVFGNKNHPCTLEARSAGVFRNRSWVLISYLQLRGHFVCIFEFATCPDPVLLKRWRKSIGMLFAVVGDIIGDVRLHALLVRHQNVSTRLLTVKERILPNMTTEGEIDGRVNLSLWMKVD